MSRDGNIRWSEVIAHAAAVLRALKDSESGLDPADIAERIRLPIRSVQRLLVALESSGLISSAGDSRRRQLGPAFVRLAASIGSKLIEIADPVIARLSSELRETVDLAILRGDGVLFIHQFIGPQRLRAVSAVGELFPLHCTANGKAILAALKKTEMLRLVPKSLPAFTANTITTRSALLAELHKIRESGVAFDQGEHTLGICAVGAAIHDAAGHQLAISVPVPSVRFYDNRDVIADRLLSARSELQQRILKTRAIAE
jgi:DNA-binding IclR family transcriptional regulator